MIRIEHTYQVVEVEGADHGEWSLYYELRPGVDADEIETEADAVEASHFCYDYYAWISGAKTLCDVVKVIDQEPA